MKHAFALLLLILPFGVQAQLQGACGEFRFIEQQRTADERYAVAPWNAIKIPDFRNAYRAALRGKQVEDWVRTLNMVSLPGVPLANACTTLFYWHGNKIHHGHIMLTIVFEPASSRIGIRLLEYPQEAITNPDAPPAGFTDFGNPTSSMKALLEAQPGEIYSKVPQEALIERRK